MPYLRRLPRVAPTGRVTARFTTSQRDVLVGSADLPPTLGHLLHRAPVRAGKLQVRLDRLALDALILVAAKAPVADRRAERDWVAFLRYLESLADRFADAGEGEAEAAD